MTIVSCKIHRQTDTAERVVSISIYKPEMREKAWACLYVIDWPKGMREFHGIGHVALQALVLALQMIGAECWRETTFPSMIVRIVMIVVISNLADIIHRAFPMGQRRARQSLIAGLHHSSRFA